MGILNNKYIHIPFDIGLLSNINSPSGLIFHSNDGGAKNVSHKEHSNKNVMSRRNVVRKLFDLLVLLLLVLDVDDDPNGLINHIIFILVNTCPNSNCGQKIELHSVG